MNSPHPRIETIFHEALSGAPAEREALVAKACAGDEALQQEVERLLAAHEDAGAFFERPNSPEIQAELARLKPEEAGERIGPYILMEQIGEGGFGTVWVAEQEQPVRRRVALKIIKLGMDTKEVVARFEQERQALAVMDHPNIAKVFDAGATQWGRPFFVMELVNGIPITQFCDEQEFTTRQRLELFSEVCSAINHAHQKGIIHRDIKPANVLVTLHGDRAVPKVIDFGIAKATQGKLTDKTLSTRFEQFVGTPVYMSPEQASPGGLDIDTRSDIYALGVLLYEMLTGKPPFDAKSLVSAGYEEMRRIIREVEPPRPSTRLSTIADEDRTALAKVRRIAPEKLSRLLERDLDWIVMKAIEKDRARRYETANDLATDIRRHLECEPVLARPPSVKYRVGKLIRKYKGPVIAVAAVVIALLVGLVASMILYLREKNAWASEFNQRQKAQIEAAKHYQLFQFLKSLLSAVDPDQAKGRDVSVLKEILDKAEARIGIELLGQEMIEVELRNTIGEVYNAVGLTVEADKQHRRALEIARLTSGPQSEVTLLCRYNVAKMMFGTGRYAEAEAECREIVGIAERALGTENILALQTRVLLAMATGSQGRFSEAETKIRAVLKAYERVLPSDSHLVLTARGDLCRCLYNQGKHVEAMAEYRELLATRIRINGPDHSETLFLRHNMARMLLDQGQRKQAEAEYRGVLEAYRRILGDEHHNTLRVRNDLAACAFSAGEIAEAEAEHRAVLAIYERGANPDHPDAIRCRASLANCLTREHRLGAALSLLKQNEARCLKVYGADHLETKNAIENREGVEKLIEQIEARSPGATANEEKSAEIFRELRGLIESIASQPSREPGVTGRKEALVKVAVRIDAELQGQPRARVDLRTDLGKAYLAMGAYADAEREFDQAVKDSESFAGNETKSAVVSRECLGLAQEKRGKYAEAETNIREAIRRLGLLEGPEHSETLSARTNLSVVLFGQGKFADAEAENRELILIVERTLGPESIVATVCRANLGAALMYLSKAVEAEAEFRKVIEQKTKSSGAEHLEVLQARSNLATALSYQNKLTEAEVEMRAVLQIRERVLGAEHPDTLTTRHNLGNVLNELGRHDEAEALFREVVSLRVRILGADHPLTLTSKNGLALAHYGQKKFAEAEAEHRQLSEELNRILGPNHPDTLKSRWNRARALKQLGRKEEGRLLALEVLDADRRVLGPNHQDTKDAEKLYDELNQPDQK